MPSKTISDLWREDLEGGVDSSPQVVSPALASDAALGKIFLASSGRLIIAAAGNFRFRLNNPTGSGKTVQVLRFALLTTVVSWPDFFINPTTGLPGGAARRNNNALLVGSGSGVAVVNADTDTVTALGGGTNTGLVFGAAANNRIDIEMPPLILPAGNSIGFNIPVAAAADFAGTIYWREV